MTTPDPQSDLPQSDLSQSGLPPAGENLPGIDPDSHQALVDEREALRSSAQEVAHTRTRATFVGLIAGAILLILLLVFILQNLESQRIQLIFWEVNLPVGVSLLIAAIAGALIVGIAGALRTIQLSRALKKAKK